MEFKNIKNNEFYKYFGINRFHFNQILEKLIEIENLKKLGRKNKLLVKKINNNTLVLKIISYFFSNKFDL